MKLIISTFILLLGITISFAQSPLHHRARIWTNDAGLQKLSSLGIETDHGDYRRNVWFVSDFSQAELERIAAAGYRYEVLIEDVGNWYQSQPVVSDRAAGQNVCDATGPSYATPANFSLGSYAGYFTYQEMLDNLDSMVSKYPSLITLKQALPGGTTIEGRPIYQVKISDNPTVDEPEHEMLYTAVHHAREPGGMSQLIFYMWYLLENYGTNDEVDQIIENTELFFVPCLNPDGYLYNELTDPAGGGLWRKNRRDNLDGEWGVDLNRNYGYNWGYDDDGSSPNTFSGTYRGDAPFSEPETQLLRDFAESREFRIALNYHTYGNLLIYPWGYDYGIYTPDSAVFAEYGNLLTTYNGYTYGTADQTVGYIVNGSSDDWMYGEQITKDKIFAMTPECGDPAYGFWPPSFEIIPLCHNTMFQNLTAALLCGKYALLEENSPEIVSTGGGYITYTLKQLGLDTTGSYTVTLTPLTPNIFSVGNAATYSNLSPMQTINDSIAFALVTPMTNGDPIRFTLTIDYGTFSRTDTIEKIFGAPLTVISSDGNSISGWTAPSWGTSTAVYYSPTASITDSPSGNYSDNEYSFCTLTTSFDLTNALHATLSFYARWEIETNYDYVQVQASSDGGNIYSALCGKYTVPGSGFQIAGTPVYEGFQFDWVKEEMSLDDFLGSANVKIRFLIGSDGAQEYDGFYFDDLLVTKIMPGTNALPETSVQPAILSVMPNPANSYFYANLTPAKSDGNLVLYDFTGRQMLTVAVQQGASSMRIDSDGIPQGVYMLSFESGDLRSTPVKLVIR
jgi:hypothetical protein